MNYNLMVLSIWTIYRTSGADSWQDVCIHIHLSHQAMQIGLEVKDHRLPSIPDIFHKYCGEKLHISDMLPSFLRSQYQNLQQADPILIHRSLFPPFSIYRISWSDLE